MRTSVDITASLGTTSQVTTTWAVTKGTENTRRDTKLDEQDDVGYYRRLHINILIRLHNFNLEWAKSQTDIGY